MAALVRVSRLDSSLIVRALSLGAHGIVVPGVRTAEEAAAIVRAVKFAPIGERGVTMGRRSYGRPGFLHDENDETVVVVQLEDPEALRNAEAIASVPHLDVAMVAQNDLAQSMGHLGNVPHPDVQHAMSSTLARIAALGPGHAAAGANVGRAADVAATLALGVRFLYASYDAWLGAAARDYLAAARRPVEGT
jgi:2-keto-3-deoxy-L-rhamnonate aldolase RhmA